MALINLLSFFLEATRTGGFGGIQFYPLTRAFRLGNKCGKLRGVFRAAHGLCGSGIRLNPFGASLGAREAGPVGNWRNCPFEERRLKVNL